MGAVLGVLATLVVMAAAQPAQRYVPDTDLVFADGTVYGVPDDSATTLFTVRQQPIGDLKIASGGIVALDAIMALDNIPFQRRVPPGSYPVVLTVAESPADFPRPAFARVQFRDEQPVRWELATVPGQDVSTLAPDHIFGYGVDSGTGGFMDAVAVQAADRDYDNYSGALQKLFEAAEAQRQAWATMDVDASSGTNVVAFMSGYGDGFYASYWGFDDADDVVCLVTDFSILEGATPAP